MALVQYVFVRTDIPTIRKGALVAQACHACVAAMTVYGDSPDTREYLENLGQMTKIVLRMDRGQCEELCSFLERSGYDYYAWVEHPEEEITSVALRPYHKEKHGDLLRFIRHYKLY